MKGGFLTSFTRSFSPFFIQQRNQRDDCTLRFRSAVSYAAGKPHPSPVDAQDSQDERLSIPSPLSLSSVRIPVASVQYTASKRWAETTLFLFLFHFRRWYRNKPEGDYTRQNTNKNASPTFYHVFGEPLHPGELAKGLSEPQQMLPLPFWYLTSPCCNSRGPAGCSQRYWCLCVLQAPGVLLCTAPSARHMLYSLKALSGQVELLPGSGVVFTFPKRPPTTAAPLLHGLRRNRRCHKKTESLCLIRRCCMAYWILIKFTFKHNSNRALIHNLPCVFYKKTAFLDCFHPHCFSDVMLPSIFGCKTVFEMDLP